MPPTRRSHRPPIRRKLRLRYANNPPDANPEGNPATPQMSVALAAAHAEAQQAVPQAAAKHVDETGWKQAGQKRWLWGAATAVVACFVIVPSRGAVGLAALLGRKVKGIVCSDRWSV